MNKSHSATDVLCVHTWNSKPFLFYLCTRVFRSHSFSFFNLCRKKKAKQIQMGLGVHKGLSIKHLELFLRITAVYALNLQ